MFLQKAFWISSSVGMMTREVEGDCMKLLKRLKKPSAFLKKCLLVTSEEKSSNFVLEKCDEQMF